MPKQIYFRLHSFKNIEGKPYEEINLLTNTYFLATPGVSQRIVTGEDSYIVVEIEDDIQKFAHISLNKLCLNNPPSTS